ncbi:MAG: HDOD domain-containing protein [Gammaproteobacteria bacterium SHHR-1]
MGFFGLFNKSRAAKTSQGSTSASKTAPAAESAKSNPAAARTATPDPTPSTNPEVGPAAGTQGEIGPEQIRHFLPIRLLPRRVIAYLAQQASLSSHPAGSTIPSSGPSVEKSAVYLIQGELEFEQNGSLNKIKADTGQATFPLPLGPNSGLVTARQRSLLAHFPLDLIRGAEKVSADGRFYGEQAKSGMVEPSLFAELIEEARSGMLELPSPPDLGVRIGRAIDKPEADSANIARIIQLDPALTARMIQVANSPLYSGLGKISNCEMAVTRLGLSTTRNLVISFLLKNLFHNPSRVLQRAMDRMWRDTTRVAAISSVLAKMTPRLDPGRAMLAGLVHNIGAIAVINDSKRHPELMDNEEYLWQAVDHVSAEVGAIIMEQWNFGDDLLQVVRHCRDWMRDDADRPNYVDLVMVAKLHAQVGSRDPTLPRLDLVPAFHKLALGKLSPKLSLVVLEQSQKEIRAVQELLN